MTLLFNCRYQYNGGFSLNAAFEAGDGVTALCGPSGSGKTTILMLIAGLLKPRAGRIVLGDRVLADTADRLWIPPHRRAVGMVFQESLLFPHYDVRANLTYGLKRRPAKRFDFDRVVNILELKDLLDRRPATLSGGQARRAAIGRALLRGPKLLLLDEPWVGLDEPLKERVATLVQRCITEWRIPMLLVGHDRRFTEGLADRLVEIKAGCLREQRDRNGGWEGGNVFQRSLASSLPPLTAQEEPAYFPRNTDSQ